MVPFVDIVAIKKTKTLGGLLQNGIQITSILGPEVCICVYVCVCGFFVLFV